jgi:hypothetical protein
MTVAPPLPEQDWLARFFSGRNELHWNAIIDGKAPAAWLELVSPWIAAFSSEDAELPIVLPIFDANGPSQWYAMACNENLANALVQDLTAVVGPSYSDFIGQPLQLDRSDEIESALHERFGRFVYRLDPVNAAARSDVSQALKLYLGLLQRRPAIPDRTQRPFGKIRGEFDRALLAGNETGAQLLRDELIASGRLDAEQQKYLEIRMLSGLGRQQQLAHDYSLIKSILGLSLPAQIMTDLVESLYGTFIAKIEDDLDVDSILAVFKSEVSNHFGPLFKELKGVCQPNVLKAFLLYELVQKEPNLKRCEAIINAYPAQSGRELIERWSGRLALVTPSNEDTLGLARQALFDDDYHLALKVSFDALPSSWAYNMMLRCAVELEDTEITRRVLDAMDAAPETVRSAWKEKDLFRYQQLLSQQTGSREGGDRPLERPDASWLSWARYVETGRYEQPPLQVLEEAVTRWTVESYLSDPTVCNELAEKIGNADGDAEQIFRDAFAALTEFFVDRPEHPSRGFIPLYTMLIRIVAWSGVVSSDELEIASVLLQELVSVGPSEDDYVEALEAFNEIVSNNAAPGNIDWAFNTTEILALSGSPDNEARLRYFVAVVDLARTYNHRLTSAQHVVLSLLAKDYGCSDLLDAFPVQKEEDAGVSAYAGFDGVIGIYTLTEPAAQRARQVLTQIVPQARVEINADKVATERLKHLAATADIFVFAWKSSKHQAYYAAREARGDLKMLLPTGKGSASILGCVLSEVERATLEVDD